MEGGFHGEKKKFEERWGVHIKTNAGESRIYIRTDELPKGGILHTECFFSLKHK